MLRVSRRYSLARLIEEWERENCMPSCPATTILYLQKLGFLNEQKIYEFLDNRIRSGAKKKE